MSKQKTRKHLRGGVWPFNTYGKVPNTSSLNPKIIAKTYANLAEKATELRAEQSQIVTVASVSAITTAATSVSMLAAGASLGIAGLVVPPVLPVMVAILVGIAFIMRQKGLNEELRSNLYFIKMEVERMFRSMNVIDSIARERNIPLNTMSLSIIMSKLQTRIMLFADEKTKKDIRELEAYLKEGKLGEVNQLIQIAKNNSEDAVKANMEKPQGGGGISRWLPTGWSSRWLSPDETLRQIIRDITIAVVWYSIMLSEFDIFNKYLDIKTEVKATKWASGPEMKELLIANRQLNDPRDKAEEKLREELDKLTKEIQNEETKEKIRVIKEQLLVVSETNDEFFYNPTQLADALTMNTGALSRTVQNAAAAEAATAAATAAVNAAQPTAQSAAPPLPPGSGGTRRKRHSRRF